MAIISGAIWEDKVDLNFYFGGDVEERKSRERQTDRWIAPPLLAFPFLPFNCSKKLVQAKVVDSLQNELIKIDMEDYYSTEQ